MLSGHLQGAFLQMVSRMLKPFRILELGTFTGYSAICLAQGLTGRPVPGADNNDGDYPGGNAVLHTIEVDPELELIIRKYFHEAGIEEKATLHIGEALKIIPTLEETWDLVFIDADKPNYLNYYKLLIDRLSPGGVIIADNALWDGKVLDPGTRSKDTLGIIEFNAFVQNDDRVENVLLPVRDGMMMIQKKQVS